MIRSITPLELKARIDAQEKITIIDVRHEWELEISQIDVAKHIVLHDIPLRHHEIPTDHVVVFMCRTGIRSMQAVHFLTMNGWSSDNLFNLEGGILRWAQDVDPRLPTTY